MSVESTRLISPTLGDERVAEDGLGGNGHQTPAQRQQPRRSCLFRTFLLIRFVSTLITLAFLVSQIGLWVLVPGLVVQKILRSYIIAICIILLAAEWEVKILPDFLSPSNNEAYKNWFYRGFQYSFIGVIGLEESYATLGHNYPDYPGMEQIAVADLLRGSSFGMFGMGVLYMIMRILFLHKLWEHVDAGYHQQLEGLRRQQSV
jgi:hypothetical protein